MYSPERYTMQEEIVIWLISIHFDNIRRKIKHLSTSYQIELWRFWSSNKTTTKWNINLFLHRISFRRVQHYGPGCMLEILIVQEPINRAHWLFDLTLNVYWFLCNFSVKWQVGYRNVVNKHFKHIFKLHTQITIWLTYSGYKNWSLTWYARFTYRTWIGVTPWILIHSSFTCQKTITYKEMGFRYMYFCLI